MDPSNVNALSVYNDQSLDTWFPGISGLLAEFTPLLSPTDRVTVVIEREEAPASDLIVFRFRQVGADVHVTATGGSVSGPLSPLAPVHREPTVDFSGRRFF